MCSCVEVEPNLKKRRKERGCEENEKMKSMSLVRRRGNVNWLKMSDVGVLKTFSSSSSRNSRLSSKGYIFSSNYLGDKYIVWSFEYENERECFI